MTSVSSTDTSSLTDILLAADLNGDGVVTAAEIASAAGTAGVDDATLAQEVIDAVDTDGDGSASMLEFSNFASQFSADSGLVLLSSQESSSAVSSLFSSLDSDGDASVTASEIAAALASASSETSSDSTDETTTSSSSSTDTTDASSTEDVLDALSAVDANSDGVFDKNDVALEVLQAAGDAEAHGNDDDDFSAVLSSLYASSSTATDATDSTSA